MDLESINAIVGELRTESEINSIGGSKEWTEFLSKAADTIVYLHEMVLELEQSKTETAQRDKGLFCH